MELQLYPSVSLFTSFRWLVSATHSSCVPGKELQYPSQGCCYGPQLVGTVLKNLVCIEVQTSNHSACSKSLH